MFLVRVLFSLYFYTWCTVGSLFIFFPLTLLAWLLTSWWDPSRRWVLYPTVAWAWFYFLSNPFFWKIKIQGREKIDRKTPTLFVSNHLSSFDVYLLFLLATPFSWVSKTSNYYVPVIGWNMYFLRSIGFDKKSPRDILSMVKRSVSRLKEGVSVFIFPEGERSLDGRLLPFLKGAFAIAKRAGVQVQPIAITGTFQILPRYHLAVNPVARMTITVLDPIPAELVAEHSVEEISDMAREKIMEALPPEALPLPEVEKETKEEEGLAC